MTLFYRFEDSELFVDIPAGIEDGQTLWLKINPKQEALVQVKVDEYFGFRRDGLNVHSDLKVNLLEAFHGKIISVQGLTKILKVKLPLGLSSHTVLKLPNQGFKTSRSYDSERGDHFIHITIDASDCSTEKSSKETANL